MQCHLILPRPPAPLYLSVQLTFPTDACASVQPCVGNRNKNRKQRETRKNPSEAAEQPETPFVLHGEEQRVEAVQPAARALQRRWTFLPPPTVLSSLSSLSKRPFVGPTQTPPPP